MKSFKIFLLGFSLFIIVVLVMFFSPPSPVTSPAKIGLDAVLNKMRGFNYKIETHGTNHNYAIPKMNVTTEQNTVNFVASFEHGGGEFESARLDRKDDKCRIILHDVDGIAINMLVTYELTGKIKGLKPGNYTLQIIDGNKFSSKGVIVEKDFNVR